MNHSTLGHPQDMPSVMHRASLSMAEQARHEVAAYANKLYGKGFTPARTGNISLRSGQTVYITPSGYSLEDVTPENVVAVSCEEQTGVSGRPDLKPSSEWPIHQAIYDARPDVGAVVHAHPPKATALCVAGLPLNPKFLAEVILSLGEVPLVPYFLTGSSGLAGAVGQAIRKHSCVLMANHGVITTGPTMRDAYYQVELLESVAEVYILAHQLDRITELTEAQAGEVRDVLAKSYNPQ